MEGGGVALGTGMIMAERAEPSIEAQWARVRARLKDEYGEAAFRSWLKPLTLVMVEGGEVRIAVPTRFMRDWVRSHYADGVLAAWRAENKSIKSVEIVVLTAQSEPARPLQPTQPAATSGRGGFKAPGLLRDASA